MHKPLLALILFIPFVGLALSQSTDSSAPPLGDVAKKISADKKDGAAKAKHVFSDDGTPIRKSPFPAIVLQGTENSLEILTAIHDFRANHGQEETEDAVHEWFDEQTEVLSTAIDANLRMRKHNQLRMEAAQDRNAYPNNYTYDPDSPSKMNERMTTERWSQRVENRSAQENNEVISRVQQTLMRVRIDVICRPNKIKPAAYDWFKIRAANGIGTY
jgi:cell pole-organizing protein PopZ